MAGLMSRSRREQHTDAERVSVNSVIESDYVVWGNNVE